MDVSQWMTVIGIPLTIAAGSWWLNRRKQGTDDFSAIVDANTRLREGMLKENERLSEKLERMEVMLEKEKASNKEMANAIAEANNKIEHLFEMDADCREKLIASMNKLNELQQRMEHLK